MTKKILQTFIYLPNEVAPIYTGEFVYDKEKLAGKFQYDSQYLKNDASIFVDPTSLPLSNGGMGVFAEKNNGLFGAFRDASPDGWGRLVVAKKTKSDPSNLDEADLLLYGGAGRSGNLEFRDEKGTQTTIESLPTIGDIPSLVKASNAVLKGIDVKDEYLDLLKQGSSLGGARPKCIVTDNNQQWVAKFPTERDQFNYARVEHASLQLAKLVGVEACESKILTIGEDKEILLVKRFDREFDETTQKFTRTGFYSGLTMMDMDEYDRNRWSYLKLVQNMRKVPMLDFKGQLEELYRRMVLNIACRNTDDHPRNHGFLVGKRHSLKLSPAYDIVPSMAQLGVGTEFYQAMTVGEQGRIGNLENALSKANHFGLTNEQARIICVEIGEVVSGWREVFSQHEVSEHDMKLFEASFAEGERMAGLNKIKQKPKL